MKKLSILIRLTNDSQFGINEEEIEEIIAKRAEYAHLDIQAVFPQPRLTHCKYPHTFFQLLCSNITSLTINTFF